MNGTLSQSNQLFVDVKCCLSEKQTMNSIVNLMRCICRCFGMVLLISLWEITPAHGAYTLSLVNQGQPTNSVRVGDRLDLDAVLTSDAADYHDSAIFRIELSTTGLVYQAYQWSEPFRNDSSDDDSKPLARFLPVELTANTIAGAAYPTNVIDIELSNIAVRSIFGTGAVARLTFTIPTNYAGPKVIHFTPVPDTFALGFSNITSKPGIPFQLSIRNSYNYWKNLNFNSTESLISGPDQDPNKDGLVNALAYAFAIDPKNGEGREHLPTFKNDNGKIMMTYVRPFSTSDLTYQYETSLNCKSWTAAVAKKDYSETTQVDPINNTEVVTVEWLTTSQRVFFVRVKCLLSP